MVAKEITAKKTINLFICTLSFLLLSLYYSNPNPNSFNDYIKNNSIAINSPFGSVLSYANLWYARQTNAIQRIDFVFFTIVKVPAYLNATICKQSCSCVFIGLLFNWVPFCYSSTRTSRFDLSQCSYKGILLSQTKCICLPSWYGENCSKRISNFEPLFLHSFNNPFFRILNDFSILELILVILISFECWFLVQPKARSKFLCSWNGIFDDWKVYSLITHSFVHKNMLHTGLSLYCFLNYVPLMYELLGKKRFLLFAVLVLVISNLSSAIARRIRWSFTDVKYLGLSPLIISIRIVLA